MALKGSAELAGFFGAAGIQRLECAIDQVELWLAELDRFTSQVELLSKILSVDERAKAEKFRFDRHRRWFILRHAFLRIFVGHYLDIPPETVSFARSQKGKPQVKQVHPIKGKLCFNDSHSEGTAFYGFSWNREIGVDIERIKDLPEMDEIVERFFSKTEIREYRRLPEEAKGAAFFRCWTRKEAYLKAIGEGLHLPLDKVVVSLGESDPDGLRRVEGRPGEPARWRLIDLKPNPYHAAAICVAKRSGTFHHRSLYPAGSCNPGCNAGTPGGSLSKSRGCLEMS